MKKHKKKIIILVIIAALGLGYLKTKISQNNIAVPATILEIKKSDTNFYYDNTGYVESKKILTVFSSNIAEVEELMYRVGDYVPKGEILLKLKEDTTDTTDLNIQKIKLNMGELKKEYETNLKLYNVGAISKSELDSSKLKYESSILDLKILEKANKKFEKYIKSPISGVIIKANVDVNYKIDPSKALFEIADLENLIITTELSNSKAKNVKEGAEVILTSTSLENSEVLKGKVTSVSKISKKSNVSNEQVTEVKIELENYSTLKPGELVDVKINYYNSKSDIVVPFNFISFENNKTYVYVVGADNKVYKRELVLGITDNINYVVKNGLKENEKILDNSLNQYKEGDTVK